jgi:ABC-type iron transport system FetAB permease component
MFWATNTASREKIESIVAVERRLSRRHSTRPKEPIAITEMIVTNAMSSVGSGTKAWIEDRTPERTRKSPTIAISPASSTSETFHAFRSPRFSWIMIEWM